MNPQPLDYSASRPSVRHWHKRDAMAFLYGALLAALLLAIYFASLYLDPQGNGIIFKSRADWGDIAFWPGYQFGYIVYYDFLPSSGISVFDGFDISLAAGIAATVLAYGLFATILRRGLVAVRRFFQQR